MITIPSSLGSQGLRLRKTLAMTFRAPQGDARRFATRARASARDRNLEVCSWMMSDIGNGIWSGLERVLVF